MQTRPVVRPQGAGARLHHVSVLVPDGVCDLELATVVTALGGPAARSAYRVSLCGSGEERVLFSAASFGVPVVAASQDGRPVGPGPAAAGCESVVVLSCGPDGLEAPASPGLLRALSAAAARGARLVGLSGGVVALAAAGLLSGRTVTTHPRFARWLAAEHPDVRVRPELDLVEDGEVVTGRGGLATGSVMVHLVGRDVGPAAAVALAAELSLPRAAGGPGSTTPMREEGGSSGEPIEDLLAWMVEHLDEPLFIEDLAKRTYMSSRTFTRRFRDLVGLTPHQWILRQRVAKARGLLETTDLLVERIALQCGFGSVGAFRTQFLRITGLAPAEYRRLHVVAASATAGERSRTDRVNGTGTRVARTPRGYRTGSQSGPRVSDRASSLPPTWLRLH